MSEVRLGLRIAKQDSFTYAMFALSTATLAFTSIQGGSNFFGEVVALFLMLTGIVGAEQFKVDQAAPDVKSADEGLSVALFSFLALTLFMVFDYVVPRVAYTLTSATYTSFWGQFTVPLNVPVQSVAGGVSVPTWFPAFMFIAVLIPNAEEQFFRGFWGNLAVSKLKGPAQAFAYPLGAVLGVGASTVIALILASTPAGALFGVFHTPAYNGDLGVIAALSADGTMVIALNSIVGRLSVSVGAHMLNNGFGFFLQKSSVLLALGFPPFPALMIQAFVLPALLLAFAIVRAHRRGVPFFPRPRL